MRRGGATVVRDRPVIKEDDRRLSFIFNSLLLPLLFPSQTVSRVAIPFRKHDSEFSSDC